MASSPREPRSGVQLGSNMTLNVSYFLLASVASGGLIESQGFGMNSAGRVDGGWEEARNSQTVLSCEFYANLQACYDALPAKGGTMLLPPNITFSPEASR